MKHALVLTLLLLVLPARAADEPLPEGAIARLGSLRLHHKDEVLSVAFTPDSKRLVSTSHDGTLRVWDAKTGEPRARFALASRDGTIAWVGTERGGPPPGGPPAPGR